MGRCCGNCEWSISPQLEEEILREQGYKEEDINRPRAGDCCIGKEHDSNFFCSHHIYVCGMEEYQNYVFYDEEYYGTGYLIVSMIDGKIDRFMKISMFGEGGFPGFFVRAYAKGCIDKPDEEFRDVSIDIMESETLYSIVNELRKDLNGKLYTIDSVNQGKSCFQVLEGAESISLIATKDVYGVKHSTNFVDISIGDNDSCQKYLEFLKFYKNLSTVSVNKKNANNEKKLILKKLIACK